MKPKAGLKLTRLFCRLSIIPAQRCASDVVCCSSHESSDRKDVADGGRLLLPLRVRVDWAAEAAIA